MATAGKGVLTFIAGIPSAGLESPVAAQVYITLVLSALVTWHG